MGLLAPLLAGNQRLQVRHQAGQSLRVQPRLYLRSGQQNGLLQHLGAPLGHGVKEAHGVEGVSEEFAADGRVLGRGEYIENSAAQGELTHALNHGRAGIARVGEPGGQLVQSVFCARLQQQGGGEPMSAWAPCAASAPPQR